MKKITLVMFLLFPLLNLHAQQNDCDNLQNAAAPAAMPVYTLPVVVHVINTGTAIGAPDNPSDSLINAMINQLNNAFRKKGSSFGGVDVKIQFKLATKSPSCGSTAGITRNNGSSVTNYASGWYYK
jgi:hypothetical protein